MAVDPIREGFHTVTPYLFMEGVDRLIDFAVAGLDAEVIVRDTQPDGTLMQAEIRLSSET
ncbi:MAG: hypothetical protein MPN21_17285 [Thermoanaerobaculia bacterium]|nr:hypothetical protein [Thermoanaerobaculia bacterium]